MSHDANLSNCAVWFDIPVANLARACQFYRAVLNIDVKQEKFNDFEFAVLAHENGNGGCLVPAADKVGQNGVLLYLNVNGRLNDAVCQVLEQEGSVIQPVHQIGPHGYRALVLDSEGNEIALHSESNQ